MMNGVSMRVLCGALMITGGVWKHEELSSLSPHGGVDHLTWSQQEQLCGTDEGVLSEVYC